MPAFLAWYRAWSAAARNSTRSRVAPADAATPIETVMPDGTELTVPPPGMAIRGMRVQATLGAPEQRADATGERSRSLAGVHNAIQEVILIGPLDLHIVAREVEGLIPGVPGKTVKPTPRFT